MPLLVEKPIRLAVLLAGRAYLLGSPVPRLQEESHFPSKHQLLPLNRGLCCGFDICLALTLTLGVPSGPDDRHLRS